VAGIGSFLDRHQLVGLDTSVFIYHYERVGEYLPATRVVMRRIARGSPAGVTSMVTVTELNTQPYLVGRPQVALRYVATLSRFPNLRLTPVDLPTAQKAAQLRARHRLRTVDALQLAAALQGGATGFLTNDRDLRRVNELEVLLLSDTDEVSGRRSAC
jgi:predicted nucleic acid-binding protein